MPNDDDVAPSQLLNDRSTGQPRSDALLVENTPSTIGKHDEMNTSLDSLDLSPFETDEAEKDRDAEFPAKTTALENPPPGEHKRQGSYFASGASLRDDRSLRERQLYG